MLSLKDWMEITDYRITEGSEYGWRCFGPDAYNLSAWNGEHDGWSSSITFDTQTQTVYTVEVCDYRKIKAYRIINPDHHQVYIDECQARRLTGSEAWDQCNFVDLESDDDFVSKAQAIVNGEDYDTRVDLPLDIPDDALFELMKQAHDQDITLNQLIENVLRKFIDDEKTKAYLSDDEFWDSLAEDNLSDSDEWEDSILQDEPPKKKKKKKSK